MGTGVFATVPGLLLLYYLTDVLGEVMIALEDARNAGLAETPQSWALQRALVDELLAQAEALEEAAAALERSAGVNR